MKIAKSRLKEIILEELANEQVNDPTKLATKAATTTQRRKEKQHLNFKASSSEMTLLCF